MNKKEVAELKKNFSSQSGYFTLYAITIAYVDGRKNIINVNTRPSVLIPSEEFELLTETLKGILSTSVGKNFTEYSFPEGAYEEGNSQDILYKTLKSELKDSRQIAEFLENITKKATYDSAYSIITGYCRYTVRQKNKSGEYNEEDIEFDFLLTAICPAQLGCDGLIFNESENEVAKKDKPSLAISKKPSDGFLFPTFSMRSPDINHVMYFTKKPKEPNISMIEDVLGCEYVMSSETEKEGFFNVLQNTLDENLDYALITTINEKLEEIVEVNKNETEPPTIGVSDIKNLLSELGVDDATVKNLDTVYEETLGTTRLTVSNLIDSKTVVTLPDITVNIRNTAKDKFRTATIGGRSVLLIDLDDPYIEINGLPTKIAETATQ